MEIHSKRIVRDREKVVETPAVADEHVPVTDRYGEAVTSYERPVAAPAASTVVAAPAPVVVTPRYGVLDRIESLIWLCAGIACGIIVLRFLLLAFGANPAAPFASGVYMLSEPLVSPFLNLFGASPTYGPGIIEYTDLVATAVYCLLAAVVVKILDIIFGRTVA